MDVLESSAAPTGPQRRIQLLLHRCQRWMLRILLAGVILTSVYLAFGLGSGSLAADFAVWTSVVVLCLSVFLCVSFWLEERRMKATVTDLLAQKRQLSASELIEHSNGVLERQSLRHVLAQLHSEGRLDCSRKRRPGGGSHRVFFCIEPSFSQSSTKITRQTTVTDLT